MNNKWFGAFLLILVCLNFVFSFYLYKTRLISQKEIINPPVTVSSNPQVSLEVLSVKGLEIQGHARYSVEGSPQEKDITLLIDSDTFIDAGKVNEIKKGDTVVVLTKESIVTEKVLHASRMVIIKAMVAPVSASSTSSVQSSDQ